MKLNMAFSPIYLLLGATAQEISEISFKDIIIRSWKERGIIIRKTSDVSVLLANPSHPTRAPNSFSRNI
jgi:hypothetical protein